MNLLFLFSERFLTSVRNNKFGASAKLSFREKREILVFPVKNFSRPFGTTRSAGKRLHPLNGLDSSLINPAYSAQTILPVASFCPPSPARAGKSPMSQRRGDFSPNRTATGHDRECVLVLQQGRETRQD